MSDLTFGLIAVAVAALFIAAVVATNPDRRTDTDRPRWHVRNPK